MLMSVCSIHDKTEKFLVTANIGQCWGHSIGTPRNISSKQALGRGRRETREGWWGLTAEI